MMKKNLSTALLVLRLTYYRVSVFERFKRFRLLMLFILAMVVPTIAFIQQILQLASISLMNGSNNAVYFMNLMIFELLAMIWVGSQYECLKIPDVEGYFRTLKISNFNFLFVELMLCSIVNAPFFMFLMIGVFFLAAKNMLFLGIVHSIYLFNSILFLSICIIFSRPVLIAILLITNLVFINFNGLISCFLLSLFLWLVIYFFVVKRCYISLKLGNIFPVSQIHVSQFFPNVYLNLKTLFIWNKVYTACIFGLNLLIMAIFISYELALGSMQQSQIGFLISMGSIVYFCSLLSYKLAETRKSYGDFFSVYYNKFDYYLFDLMSIFIVSLLNLVVLSIIGLYLGASVLLILKIIFIALVCVILFFSLNRLFFTYGPVISLLAMTGILVISRGWL
ncbi:MAG: hypothetical protein V4496_04795 [Pseudomonadota bacterium]